MCDTPHTHTHIQIAKQTKHKLAITSTAFRRSAPSGNSGNSGGREWRKNVAQSCGCLVGWPCGSC